MPTCFFPEMVQKMCAITAIANRALPRLSALINPFLVATFRMDLSRTKLHFHRLKQEILQYRHKGEFFFFMKDEKSSILKTLHRGHFRLAK